MGSSDSSSSNPWDSSPQDVEEPVTVDSFNVSSWFENKQCVPSCESLGCQCGNSSACNNSTSSENSVGYCSGDDICCCEIVQADGTNLGSTGTGYSSSDSSSRRDRRRRRVRRRNLLSSSSSGEYTVEQNDAFDGVFSYSEYYLERCGIATEVAEQVENGYDSGPCDGSSSRRRLGSSSSGCSGSSSRRRRNRRRRRRMRSRSSSSDSGEAFVVGEDAADFVEVKLNNKYNVLLSCRI